MRFGSMEEAEGYCGSMFDGGEGREVCVCIIGGGG